MPLYRFDLYIRYTVEIELPDWLNTLPKLNDRVNHDFAPVLRQYFPNLQMYACAGPPDGYNPTNPVFLQNDQEVDSYMRSMNGRPVFEVRLPGGYNAWDNYNQWYNSQIHQLQHLQGQVTELRKAGQGLQQGFALLQQASNAKDDGLIQVVRGYGQGIDPCITCMVGQPGDAWTATHGTRLLAYYAAGGPQYLTEIWEAHGFEPVILAMNAFPQDPHLQQHGCHFVALVAGNPAFHSELHRLGAVQTIIRDLQQFPTDPPVQQHGCWALGQLASSPEWRSEMVTLHGLDVLVQALRHHPGDPYVNRYATQGLQPFAVQPDYTSEIVRLGAIEPMVTALQHHGKDPEVVYHVLTSLGELGHHPDGKVAIGNAGATPVILTVMKTYQNAPMVQETGLRCLAALAAGNPQNQALIFHAGGIPPVINAVSHASDSRSSDEHTVGLTAQGLNLLANLASHTECRPQIVQYKGVETTTKALKSYPTAPRVQEHGLRVFAGLASSPEAISSLMAAGIPEAVVQSMNGSMPEAAVQMNGSYALGMLSGSDESKVRIAKAGGVETMLTALNTHAQPLVHEQACGALASMLEHPAAKQAFQYASIGQPGQAPVTAYQAVDSSLRYMSSHPATLKQALKLVAVGATDEIIRLQCLGVGMPEPIYYCMQDAAQHVGNDLAKSCSYYSMKALAGLLAPYPSADWYSVCTPILSSVVSTMQEYPNDEPIQEGGCEVLSVLARGEGMQEVVLNSTGIQVTCTALKNFPSDMEVQRKGCRTLANMAEHPASRPVIRQEGGVNLVIASLKYFAPHPEVGEQGCAALANMALDDETRYEIVRQGGIDVCLTALRHHTRHPGIQAYGMGALGNFAVDEENCQVILRGGGLDMVIYAMTTWPDDPRVQNFGCLALSNYAHDDANKALIAQKGGLRLIITTMQRHADHGGVIEQACGALANLGTSPRILNDIAQLQGIEYVVAGLKKHTMCILVQENACFALAKFLATPNEQYRQRMKAAGAEEALVYVKDSPDASFDVKICVSVLLRRLGEEMPTSSAYHLPGATKAAVEVNKDDNIGSYDNYSDISTAASSGYGPSGGAPGSGYTAISGSGGTSGSSGYTSTNTSYSSSPAGGGPSPMAVGGAGGPGYGPQGVGASPGAGVLRAEVVSGSAAGAYGKGGPSPPRPPLNTAPPRPPLPAQGVQGKVVVAPMVQKGGKGTGMYANLQYAPGKGMGPPQQPPRQQVFTKGFPKGKGKGKGKGKAMPKGKGK